MLKANGGPVGEGKIRTRKSWRREAESNRRYGFCRPMPYHLATAPPLYSGTGDGKDRLDATLATFARNVSLGRGALARRDCRRSGGIQARDGCTHQIVSLGALTVLLADHLQHPSFFRDSLQGPENEKPICQAFWRWVRKFAMAKLFARGSACPHQRTLLRDTNNSSMRRRFCVVCRTWE
jgi:hypothetical protein